MKRLKYSVFTLLILLTAAGCKKSFFDINENPNDPTEEAVTPQLLLPTVLTYTSAKMATGYDYCAFWMGYWARSGSYGQSLPLENYDLTASYQTLQWRNSGDANTYATTGWYNNLNDVSIMERKAKVSGLDFYVAIAKTMKSIGFMYLVDQYNNVPYKEAFNISGTFSPKYDRAEDIYKDLIAQLDTAATLVLRSNADETPGLAEADVMFGGDSEMWLRFINTQRLKLLLRQSQLFKSSAPSAEIAKILNDGKDLAGGPFLMTGQTAEVNPGFAVDNGRMNPFWETYNLTAQGAIVDNFNRANNYVLNKYRNNNDVRYQYFFSKARIPVDGNEYYGYNFGEILPSPVKYRANQSSNVAGPGLAKSATQPQWLFTSVESLFLQAEAIQRGWLTGNAQAAYTEAVHESFRWLGVDDAEAKADAYLAQSNSISNWSMAANKIDLIVMQKYLALCGVNNFEAWVDYRRLGIPKDLPLSLNPSRASRTVPLRLIYPSDEYSYNSSNVGEQGTINAQTSKVFWDAD